MKVFRKIVFWLHLVCGLATGLVIFIMSFTGVIIAFEREAVDWLERGQARVDAPADARPLPVADLRARLAERFPDFKTATVTIPRDPQAAYQFRAGRAGELYVNPYTGVADAPSAESARAFFQTMVAWHRWLGAKDGPTSTARLVTGVSNAVFAGLCITGIYLWLPGVWNRRTLAIRLWLPKGLRGKARDYNWHHALGLWTAPVLLALSLTGVIISFQWGHELVFRLTGDDPARFREFRTGPAAPPMPDRPAGSAAPLETGELLGKVLPHFPDWKTATVKLAANSAEPAPVDVVVMTPALLPSAGRIQLHADPFSGEILKQTAFADQSPGVRARVWLRFLHTGEALGIVGRIVAVLATAISLVLVWTGYALSWRRFRPRKRHAPQTS